jgi:hypothetical protein
LFCRSGAADLLASRAFNPGDFTGDLLELPLRFDQLSGKLLALCDLGELVFHFQGLDPWPPFLADVIARFAEVQGGPVDALHP